MLQRLDLSGIALPSEFKPHAGPGLRCSWAPPRATPAPPPPSSFATGSTAGSLLQPSASWTGNLSAPAPHSFNRPQPHTSPSPSVTPGPPSNAPSTPLAAHGAAAAMLEPWPQAVELSEPLAALLAQPGYMLDLGAAPWAELPPPQLVVALYAFAAAQPRIVVTNSPAVRSARRSTAHNTVTRCSSSAATSVVFAGGSSSVHETMGQALIEEALLALHGGAAERSSRGAGGGGGATVLSSRSLFRTPSALTAVSASSAQGGERARCLANRTNVVLYSGSPSHTFRAF